MLILKHLFFYILVNYYTGEKQEGLNFKFSWKHYLICSLGSIGDKFYIILQGSVSVLIPNSDIRDFRKRFDEYQKHI